MEDEDLVVEEELTLEEQLAAEKARQEEEERRKRELREERIKAMYYLEDPRYEWIRSRVYDGFNLWHPLIFRKFLETYEYQLSRFLNKGPTPDGDPCAIFFYEEHIDPKKTGIGVIKEISTEDFATDVYEERSRNVIAPFSSYSDESTDNKSDRVTLLHMATGSPPEHVLSTNIKCFYFLRCSPDMVPIYLDIEEAELQMSDHIEYGLLSGHPLNLIYQILHLVYEPLLAYRNVEGVDFESLRRLTTGVEGKGSKVQNDSRRGSASNRSRKKSMDGRQAESTINSQLSQRGSRRQSISSDAKIDMVVVGRRKVSTDIGSANEKLVERLKEIAETTPKKEFTDEVEEKKSSYAIAVRDEFQSSLHKFMEGTSNILDHVQGSLHLQIPKMRLTGIMGKDLKNIQTMAIVHEACYNYQSEVNSLLESTLKKARVGSGPLVEVYYWKNRENTLHGVIEQLQNPVIKYMLELHCKTAPDFELVYNDLMKYSIEAKDNVRFLSTLERHFRNIKYGVTFQTVTETLPPLMKALRMVWIISRHYNTDELFVPLLERVAYELCQRVTRVIHVNTIFNEPLQTVKEMTSVATDMLQTWKDAYFQIRAKIESSGRDVRWEFDRKRLFDRTDYIKDICLDVNQMAHVLVEFYNTFGHELKSVTGDAERIDDIVEEIHDLIQPLYWLDYDPFDMTKQPKWNALKTEFYKKVTEIEEQGNAFIDDSFQMNSLPLHELASKTKVRIPKRKSNLRSSEGAFQLLEKLKNIESRAVIKKQMQSKFKNIIVQYIKEVDNISHIFMDQNADPIVYRAFPPVAGKIYWERSLFYIIKANIIKFRTLEEVLVSEIGKMASDKYLILAKNMKKYEDHIFFSWYESVEKVIPEYLEVPVLKLENPDAQPPVYVLNMNPNMNEIMIESRLLLDIRLPIPSIASNTLLNWPVLVDKMKSMTTLLQTYYDILNDMKYEESMLLKDKVQKLGKIMEVPSKRMNWYSLNVPDYVERCLTNLNQFRTHFLVIRRNMAVVENILNMVMNTSLFKQKSPLFSGHVIPCKSQFDYIMHERESDMDLVVKRVGAISGIIAKTESVLPTKPQPQPVPTFQNGNADDGSGVAQPQFSIYKDTEMKILKALTVMITENLKDFLSVVKGSKQFVSIEAILAPPDIILNPQTNDIYKMFTSAVKDCITRTKKVARWLNGTCTAVQPIKVEFQDEPFLFSYFPEINANQELHELATEIEETTVNLLHAAQKYVRPWGVYRHLWRAEKGDIIEKWMAVPRTFVDFDYRFQFYTKCISDMDHLKATKRIGCIQISTVPLAKAAIDHAKTWIKLLQNTLHKRALTDMDRLQYEMMVKSDDLEDTTDNLDELKSVLCTIQSVKDLLLEWETRWTTVQQEYQVLINYNYQVPKSELELQAKLPKIYDALLMKARNRDCRLITVKTKFRAITERQVAIFKMECEEFYNRFTERGPGSNDITLAEGAVLLEKMTDEATYFEERRVDYSLAEKLLGLPITVHANLLDIMKQLEGMESIFHLYKEQSHSIAKWSDKLWVDLDIGVLNKGIDEYIKQLRKMPKNVRKLVPAVILDQQMREFRDSLPLIVDLKSEALRERHWQELMKKTGQYFDMNPATFTLSSIFSMNLSRFTELIQEIVAAAVKEMNIEKGIAEVEENWKRAKFIVNLYVKDNRKAHILGPVDEILQALDDTAVNLQSMSASRFIGPFLPTVSKWEKILSRISEVLEVWLIVQRKWMYLEGIFGGGDISKQLPEQARYFDKLDYKFKKIMTSTFENPNIKHSCHVDHRLEDFQDLSLGLENCQKSLNDYLDSKRNAFPRFFFISDDELLSILGSSDPHCVQEHIIKMYDNIASLKMAKLATTGPLTLNVIAMVSAENEIMDLKNPISTSDRVENWMGIVLEEMRKTNRLITKEAIFYYCYKKTRADWMLDYQGMVCLAGSQVWWTWEVEDVFRKIKAGAKMALKEYAKKMHMQIDQLVVKVRSKLPKNDRKKYNTALIVDVHARDIVDGFVRDSIMNEREFEWESQLRFYWVKETDNLVIRQCTGSFAYGYEYMGLNGRLVITPLTDRIYLTLTQALSMNLGGAPAGPAGTGKTETTKDLAKALGLLCLVTNCGEGMDYKAFGKILSGLCQCGAWGCMDEFNRIDISVLSVISTQLQTIRHALIMNLHVFTFEGQEIPLDRRVGVFITMNPGYAGRTELPESVKALFRPVVVIVPDLQQICEIMLFSEGFLMAKVLAKKMTVLYKLSKEQLSKQFHYDFGLRALKSVLVMAGELKRSAGELDEDLVLMRALRDMNLPKFVFEDVPLFIGLISDLFPGLDCPRVRYPEFNTAVESVLEENDFIVLPIQVDKVIQLYETMMTRHTTMLVGPTGGGKSVVLNTLTQTQTRLGTTTKLYIINPKERPVIELYGVLDPVSRDWTDGLLSNIFREINRPTEKKELRYIVYDGDVDALWVENMNSVMDDNKLLTLSNGERIRLQNYCAMLFEVYDLQYASPATISRCGMVYVDPKNLGFSPYWQRWVKTRPSSEHNILDNLYKKYVPGLIDLVVEAMSNGQQVPRLKTILPYSNLNMVTQLTMMLTATLADLEREYSPEELEALMIQGLVWSIGATLLEKDRLRFDDSLKYMASLSMMLDPKRLATLGELPGNLTLYDYVFNMTTSQWIPWSMEVPGYIHDPARKFHDILVPTVETVRATWLLELMVKIRRPVVFVGDTGTSKTATILNFLHGIDEERNMLLKMNFSSRTTSLDVQRNLEANIEKRTKDTYGPPSGKRLIVFIDDLNMPQVDTYGTQQPIAMLKLLLDRGGIYDRSKELNWKNVKDLSYIASMGKAGGGRNETDPRFVSLFTVINMTFPEEISLMKIYVSILEGHLEPFNAEIKNLTRSLTRATMELYNQIVKDLPPTPSKFHYIFNLRDLSRIYNGLCLSTPDRFTTVDAFLRLWRNECMRVISDRLITADDKKFIQSQIQTILSDEFKSANKEEIMKDPILYGDYRYAMDDGEIRIYEDIMDYEACKAIFNEILEDYNENHGNMPLVLFDDALEHLTRIHRVLRMDRANSLLVGVGGSGKQSLCHLAAYTAGCEVFQIMLSRGYNEASFRDDLKVLYGKLGMENKQMVFLFTDQHVVEDGFLELINNMLTTGMVPALYADDEKEGIINSLQNLPMSNMGAGTDKACAIGGFVWDSAIQPY